MKDLSKVSTPELAVFSNKMLTYITDLDKGILRLDALRDANEGKKVKMLFDIQGRRKKLVDKVVEAQKIYNKTQLELEERCSKKVGFKFDYHTFTKTIKEIDEQYAKIFKPQ